MYNFLLCKYYLKKNDTMARQLEFEQVEIPAANNTTLKLWRAPFMSWNSNRVNEEDAVTLICQSIDIDPGIGTVGISVLSTVTFPSTRFVDGENVMFYPSMINTLLFDTDLTNKSLFDHGKIITSQLATELASFRKAKHPITVRIENQFDPSRGVGFGNPIYSLALMIGGFFCEFFDPDVRDNKTVEFVSAETKIMDVYLERKVPRVIRKEISWEITRLLLKYYRQHAEISLPESHLNVGRHDGCDCYMQGIMRAIKDFDLSESCLAVNDVLRIVQSVTTPYNEKSEWDIKKRQIHLTKQQKKNPMKEEDASNNKKRKLV